MRPQSQLYPTQALALTEQPPVVLMAMCLFGEARGESEQTRGAVAQVVVNRARHAHIVFGSRRGLMFHENIVRVITQPRQFSCFLENDVNYPKIFDPLSCADASRWDDCMAMATEALKSEKLPDSLTYNSDHYFDDSIAPPSWADPAKATVKFGRLRFFRLYLPEPQARAETDRPAGQLRIATAQPFLPTSLPDSSTASGEARHTGLPAPAPPMFQESPFGLTRWLGGWERTSLTAASPTEAESRAASAESKENAS